MDVGSHTQLSNQQKWCIYKQTRLWEIVIAKYLPWVHTHAHCYPSFDSGMKTGMWPIALCGKDIALLCQHREQQ